MTAELSNRNWRILRAVLRSTYHGRGDPTVAELRPDPSRGTADGKAVHDLVRIGLLEFAPARDGEGPGVRVNLTPAGRYAAEYGEYRDADTGVALIFQPANDHGPNGGVYPCPLAPDAPQLSVPPKPSPTAPTV